MADWKQDGIAWMKRREPIGSYMMWSLKRPEGYQCGDTFPWGWVYVFEHKEGGVLDIVESYRLEKFSPLEQECVAYAMREKYKARD